jgi:hypothetical protein
VTYPLIFPAILLTLLAAAYLVFRPRSTGPHRMTARVVLILLFASEGVGLGGLWQLAFSAGTVALLVAAMTVSSLILAQSTGGAFRWITTLAAIALILWWAPILAILTSGQFLR